jgi:5'-nucleotidase
MIILIDMDNTLAEFDAGFLDMWRRLYPDEIYVPLADRKSFHPHRDYPERLHERIHAICHSKNFILNLTPTPGGINAVRAIVHAGHDVRFCTSYLYEYEFCVVEKYAWIEKHFGKEYIEKIIIIRDKTLIRGDILIDDKPEISGVAEPLWEHVMYDRPYNRHIDDKRRLTWQNWRDMLPEIIS